MLPTQRRLTRTLAVLAALAFVSFLIYSFVSRADKVTARAAPVHTQHDGQGRLMTPAGELVRDVTTRQPAVGALSVGFVRSPDTGGADGRGRYLVAVNSGFGIQFNAATNRAQQSLAVIDLDARPAPAVIQNVYFPTPQSVNVGVAFAPAPAADGAYTLYASGGFENKIWVFRFLPNAARPISPASPGPNTNVEAPFIDVSGFARRAASPRYNDNRAPVYPTGLATDGTSLYVANNLDDSLGIVSDINGRRELTRVELRRPQRPPDAADESGVYPYGVALLTTSPADSSSRTDSSIRTNLLARKVYVSLWNDASIAVVNLGSAPRIASHIPVARHPTAMIFNGDATRLYVVNSNADNVSVIDTRTDREIERIDVRLAENNLLGSSPESLALGDDGSTLYVANAHSNSVAAVNLSTQAAGIKPVAGAKDAARSIVHGYIPTGQYPSAIAFARGHLFVGNGKGTGFENSSLVVNNTGRAPNAPNDRFPVGTGRGAGAGGELSIALISGNISRVSLPDERTLARYTQDVMRNNNLIGAPTTRLFPGASSIKHVIYVIKENRTYDQIFGDVARSGDGTPADGDATLAIFGAGDAAQSVTSKANTRQDITPNHRALALRFGLFDRFFVNSEASPDGHNWSTAAFSTDYTDKAYRWHYSGRGRTYDFEGFNRLPNIAPLSNAPPFFAAPVDADRIAENMRRYIPYLNNNRDVAEPESLYLWDACKRAGLTFRNYGEFVATVSENDVAAINANKTKTYPDTSPTLRAVPTKRTLENNHSPTFRNYDLNTPDAITVESYRAAREQGGTQDPAITRTNSDERFRGNSRFGEWLAEFETYVADRSAGRGDRLPNLSIVRLSNDHTDGLRAGRPTPQFYVADNDYALGRLVETISNSPYWRDTAIIVVEDDAQDGPDHVDAHRSVALVISAYNRPGALIHDFHNTVSIIRTMELLLGLPPMNALDAAAIPVNIFRQQADLSPYRAALPQVALDNLITPPARDAATRLRMRLTAEQNMAHADMADPRTLNEIIWFSVRGDRSPVPAISRLPLFDAMRAGLLDDDEEEEEADEDEDE